MPGITVDGQSLSVDGRRLWLVGGTVAYHRVPRELWESRLAAASRAGLNCIETPVVWSLHEPRPGAFKFDGDLDLPAFIKLIAARGLRCILRVGPYVGEGLDLGGLPPWLLPACTGKLRSGATEFMSASSRFLGQLCERVRELQVTFGRKGGGPIVAVQNEHHWFCGDETQGAAYLAELSRFLRENGITVPILGANNLYHSVEGEIDVWHSHGHVQANVRQLRAVRPSQPRFVTVPVAGRAHWGRPAEPSLKPAGLMRQLAEALASGGQYVVSPFCGGTNFGFSAGRDDESARGFVCTAVGADAPFGEGGEPGPLYPALKRISTFASQFESLFASLDPAYQPATIVLDGVAARTAKKPGPSPYAAPLSLVERKGTQGSVIFVFAAEGADAASPRSCSVLLGDGSTLPFDLGEQPVGWIVLDALISGKGRLDYSNLNVFAVVGDVLVCFGRAGATGLLSINDSAFEVIVPDGAAPLVEEHSGVTLVVCNESQIDATFFTDDAVYVGVRSLSLRGEPLPHPSFKKYTKITARGEMSAVAAPHQANAKPRPLPALNDWASCDTRPFIDGSSERFASIDGPATLADLGAPLGYGWLRLKLKGNAPKGVHAGFFDAADRLHLFCDGVFIDTVGEGPCAEPAVVTLPLKAREHTLSILIDNLGRSADASLFGDRKGLFGHVWHTSSMKLGVPKLEEERPLEPLKTRSPIFGLEDGDITDARRITWKFIHKKKTPVALELPPIDDPALVILNGTPLGVLPRSAPARLVLHAEQLSRGGNVLQIALVGDVAQALAACKAGARFYECEDSLTAKASFAFAKWEPPAASKFKKVEGAKGFASHKGSPAWWRARFTIDGLDGPLFLDASGLTKGQIFINGHNAGRYWVATRAGKNVPPQSRWYLPEPWLLAGANELMIFDEHGFSPEKCRLTRG